MTQHEPVESPDETTVFPYHDLTPPTTRDVYRAREIVREHLPRTPLVRSDPLSEEFDADVYLKREDTLPTGAFKVRGGLNLVANLDETFHDPGLIAASTGNHGQSIAYAGQEFDVPVVVAVPEGANPDKVAAMERLGARVEHRGDDFDEAREWAEQQAAREGYRYVHSANEPALVAGVGTGGLEVVEDLPDVDTVFCPIGGGSSASGYCLTAGELAGADVIGVQSEQAQAMYRAWHEGHLEPHAEMETFVEGLSTKVPFALTTDILREGLTDFLRVPDTAIRDAVADLAREEHLIVEGAAATALAGARERADDIAGETVVIQISGRNISLQKHQQLLEGAEADRDDVHAEH